MQNIDDRTVFFSQSNWLDMLRLYGVFRITFSCLLKNYTFYNCVLRIKINTIMLVNGSAQQKVDIFLHSDFDMCPYDTNT